MFATPSFQRGSTLSSRRRPKAAARWRSTWGATKAAARWRSTWGATKAAARWRSTWGATKAATSLSTAGLCLHLVAYRRHYGENNSK
jgi:hypothetical protein